MTKEEFLDLLFREGFELKTKSSESREKGYVYLEKSGFLYCMHLPTYDFYHLFDCWSQYMKHVGREEVRSLLKQTGEE